MNLKKYTQDESYSLFCHFSDIYSERNVLFLGEDFNIENNTSILKLSWNTVFTTIRNEHKIDKILNILETEKRKVTLIGAIIAQDYISKISNPNCLTNNCDLKLIQLFDCEEDEEISIKKLIPAKKAFENYCFNYLKNYGNVFFLGYGEDDPLAPDKLFECLFELGEVRNSSEFIYFFGITEKMIQLINLCRDEKYIVLSEDSLVNIWGEYLTEYEYDTNNSVQNLSENNKEIMFFIDGKTSFIPQSEEKEVLPFAELLEFKKLNPAPKERHKYRLWFASFLKHDLDTPKWYGYKEGFVLKRKFQEELYNVVKMSLEKPSDSNYHPILLHGQSGSGKTIAMGLLAYKIFHEKQFPVVYITDSNVSFFSDDNDATHNFEKIKKFLQYIQNTKKARAILLIWDCSGHDRERKDYLRLYQKLKDFGINIVLVGTSYQLTDDSIISMKTYSNDYKIKALTSFYDIKADIDISNDDIKNLDILLKKKARMDEEERSFIIEHLVTDIKNKRLYADNFLALFYNIFWNIREDLSDGIQKEFLTTLSDLKNMPLNHDDSSFLAKYTIKNYERYKEMVSKLFDASVIEESIDEFTQLTAFFTYYNKEISLDLACSILNQNIDVLKKVLNAPIFSVQIYSDRITYKIRTRFEAQLLLRSYGIDIKSDHQKIAKYLCHILYQIECQKFSKDSEREIIEIVTRIISSIGPNSNPVNDTKWDDEKFEYYAPCIICGLNYASDSVLDPRLIVQDLSLSREYYNFKKKNPDFKPISYDEFCKFFENIWNERDIHVFSKDNYEPNLQEKISMGREYLREYENIEYEFKAYFEQIKIDIANSLISIGNLESIKEAINLCNGIINQGISPHSATTWLKANNAVIENKNADINMIEKMIAFAVNAIQFDPSLTEDRYFVNEYFKLIKYNVDNIIADNLEQIAHDMHIQQPTSALIFCWIYSELYKNGIIIYTGDSLKWNNITNKSREFCIIGNILDTIKKYEDTVQSDSKCAYLRLQLFWLLNNGKPLDFKNEKQYTKMGRDKWEIIEKLCNDTINSSRIEEGMYIYHCKYIKAIAFLQLGNYDSARKLLSEIKYKLNYMKVYTKHIICNSDGTPRLFSGKNVNLNDNDNSGGKLDMYTEKGVSIKNVYFNRFNITANTAMVLEQNSRIEKLMMGVGFMGINALRWENKKEEVDDSNE